MERFDETVTKAMTLAQSQAIQRKNSELSPIHLLYGLLKTPKSVASKYLQSEENTIIQLLESLPTLDKPQDLAQLKASSSLSEWITLAMSHAIEQGRDLIQEVDLVKHIKQYFPTLQIEPIEGQDQEAEVPAFLDNLNERFQAGKLDPVIGRAQEIRRLQEILSRRTKNNPVLIGLPGVGKTAIVEGFVGLIEQKQVPESIQGKTVYSLNMGSLMAGTKYRGEFEERITELLSFIKKNNRNIILFIDEIHLIIGAGKTDGALDIANLLKPALARGELNCIGATTYDEYKRYIESDSALERRFHSIQILEPTAEDSIQILIGLREKLEIHHQVEVSDAAIVAAVYFSQQFITSRFLPDKAIDALDEACAALKFSAELKPPELEEQESLIRSKKVLAAARPKDMQLQNEISVLEEKFNIDRKEWEEKTKDIKIVAALKKELEQLNFEYQQAEQTGDFEKASRLKHATIPERQKELDRYEISWKVESIHVAEVIARITGIDVERILQDRQEKFLQLEGYLKKRILGQDEALTTIADNLITAHAGLHDTTRALGSFLLLGSSGVGKTETAKAIASFLFGDNSHLLTLDLSEYSEAHSIAKLIGAPPGYVGYEKGGILTEAIRKKPYSVILFDEIEKAHIDFSDILLQILDEGRLTDTQGKQVDFKNTILFLTSNLKEPRSFLKPELLGRLDAILEYKTLSEEVILKLVNKELIELNAKLQNKDIVVNLSESMRHKIVEQGFDPAFGARPLKLAFQKLVVQPVAKKLLFDPNIKGTIELN